MEVPDISHINRTAEKKRCAVITRGAVRFPNTCTKLNHLKSSAPAMRHAALEDPCQKTDYQVHDSCCRRGQPLLHGAQSQYWRPPTRERLMVLQLQICRAHPIR